MLFRGPQPNIIIPAKTFVMRKCISLNFIYLFTYFLNSGGPVSPPPPRPAFPPARALPFLLHFDLTISDVWSLNLLLLACVDVGVYWAAIDFRIGRQIVSFIIYYRKRAKLGNIPRIFYTVGYSVQTSCATTSHKRPPPMHNWPPIQNTRIFPVKALQLEP